MRHLTIGLAICAMTLTSPALFGSDDDTVIMFVRDGSRNLELMLDEEVLVMKNMLEQSGYAVEIATVSGENLKAGEVELAVDHKVSEVSMAEYEAVVLPCMAPVPGSEMDTDAVQLVRQANADGKPIAASRGSVSFLAKAGALTGRRYAFAQKVDTEKRPEFDGGTFVGTGVERDDTVSTAGICPLASRGLKLPDGTKELTQAFIDSINERK